MQVGVSVAAHRHAPLDFALDPWPRLSPGAKEFTSWLLTRDPGEDNFFL